MFLCSLCFDNDAPLSRKNLACLLQYIHFKIQLWPIFLPAPVCILYVFTKGAVSGLIQINPGLVMF